MSAVCSQRPAPDVIYLDAIGGPAHGARTIPWGVRGQARMTPPHRYQMHLVSNGLAVYVWCPIREAFVCRYEEAA